MKLDPADLVDFALGQQIDLVVMATQGRGGIPRAVLGGMADRLVRCGAPVLLVPPAGSTEAARRDDCVGER